MKLLKNVLGSLDNVFDATPILVLPLETESFAAVCKRGRSRGASLRLHGFRATSNWMSRRHHTGMKETFFTDFKRGG